MNFRMLAAPVWPRRRLFASMAVTMLGATFLATNVSAQTPAPAPATPAAPAPKATPKAAAPKAAPKGAAPAPAPQAQQAPAAPPPAAAATPPPDQQIQLIYSPWTKFCIKNQQDPAAKQVCFTGKDGRIESGQPVVAAAIIEPEGEPTKLLRVTVPLGMLLSHGTRIIVDNNQPAQSAFWLCLQNGCMANYEMTPDLLNMMKKGQNLYVQAIQPNNQPITLPVPLGDFAKAYDGPPTDPKQFEENQRKLQEELQKRAEEARKKLEGAQPAGGATPNPAAK